MKKKFAVIVLLIVFLITFKSCRNEEILEKNENNTEQLKLIKSKSLWKENIIFISKVKRVFDKKVDAKKFRKKHGNAFWEYALSFEKDGEPYIFVPIVKDNKVEEVMLVLKKKKKIYFYFNKDDASKKAFFDILIKEKSAKAGSEVRKGGASNRLVCGWREIVWVWNTGLIETTYDYFCVEIDAAYIDTDLGGNTGFDLDDGDLPGGSSDNEITDPCEMAKLSLSTANSLLTDIDVKTKMNDVLKAKINVTNEWAVSVGKNSDGTYSVSNPQEGTADKGNVPPVPSGNYVADGHTHSGDFGAPSAGDFYNMLQKSLTEPYFKTRYVYGNYFGDDEVYVLVIDDSEKAKQFLNLYPSSSNYDTTSHSFISNSDVGKDFIKAKNYYTGGTYINTGDDYTAESIGLAYVLQKFNTGVSLARMDANGNFKKIIVNEEQITIPGGNGIPKTGLNISKCQ